MALGTAGRTPPGSRRAGRAGWHRPYVAPGGAGSGDRPSPQAGRRHARVRSIRRVRGLRGSRRVAGMRVAVTGGAGFIGIHTVEALVAADATVLVFDDMR